MRHRKRIRRFQAQAILIKLPATAHLAAEVLGITKSTIQRWRNPKTMISAYEADEYAIKLGVHPSEIWTDWFEIHCEPPKK